MRPPPHLPFSIPFPASHRRESSSSDQSSISEASSKSESEDAPIAYKDDVHDVGSTYPLHSSMKGGVQDVKYKDASGYTKETYGKDASMNEDEDENVEDILDEEERVGLMMQDRSAVPKQANWSAKSNPKATSLFLHLKPYLFVGLTGLAILILIPLLSWLSSSTNTRRKESVLKAEKHLMEITIPSYWRMPPISPSSKGAIRKPKRPLPPGQTKMTSFGPPFSLETIVDPIPTGDNFGSKKKDITLEDAVLGTFSAATNGLTWSAEDPDEGVFVFKEHSTGNIIIEDVTHRLKDTTGKGEVAKGGGKVIYLKGKDVKDNDGKRIEFEDFKISPDMRFILLFSDRNQQWRYSSHSKVWLHDVTSHSTQQIGKNLTDSKIATAEWSSKSYISFVEDNNLFLIKDPHNVKDFISITSDGNKNIFNAIPDWVYEEEVFSGDTAHWWSPDGNKIAFIRFDETDVMSYSFPVYNPTETNGKALLYTDTVDMKYPKPGTPNPKIGVFVYDVVKGVKSELKSVAHKPSVETDGSEAVTIDTALVQAGDEIMVTEVKWLNDNMLIIRATNRVSDVGRYEYYDTNMAKLATGSSESTIEGRISRREMTTQTGGWITVDQEITSLYDDGTPDSSAYVDIVAIPNGFRHIAYYRDASQSNPIFLTAGEWEVEEIIFVQNNRVYFSAAYPRPSVRHILYVDIPRDSTATIKPVEKPMSLTDVRETAWYEADFDPKGNYYQLTYQGPHLPWVKVLSLRDPKFELVLQDNSRLKNELAQYQQPQRLFYNITLPDHTVVSAQEFRPHDFDSSGAVRYPVLIKVYGGPNSQMVDAKWSMGDWTSYLTCTLGYIVIVLDGRGTGFRGRAYRDVVSWQLGVYESNDVVQAAEAIRRLPYVAQSKVGIWGWSFGGYLTAKALERDTGTFDLGMSVAPVSRWEFYDTIYTERYMKTPHLNKAGYENSSVHINKGFQNSHFLLAQGSGDDNVHFQSSAHLLDQLTGKKIRGFWFRMFTDSAHSISKRGAYLELHQFLTRFLVYNWGSGGKRIFRYEEDKDILG